MLIITNGKKIDHIFLKIAIGDNFEENMINLF